VTGPFDPTPIPGDWSESESPTPESPESQAGSRRWVLWVAIAVVAVVLVAVVVVARSSSGSDGGGVAAPTTVVQSEDAAAKLCQQGEWPKLYNGRPMALDATSDAGFFFWGNPSGWSARVRSGIPATDYTIRLTTSHPINRATLTVDSPDNGSLVVEGNTATFKVNSNSGVNGIDFGTCQSDTFRLDLLVDERLAAPGSVFVGPNNRALQNPLLIERT